MFCMRLRGGKMLPEVPLPAGSMSVHDGKEIECHGESVADMYENVGRGGPLDRRLQNVCYERRRANRREYP